jgi:hypothetical protein
MRKALAAKTVCEREAGSLSRGQAESVWWANVNVRRERSIRVLAKYHPNTNPNVNARYGKAATGV